MHGVPLAPECAAGPRSEPTREGLRSRAAIYEPGVHVCYMIFPEGVPFVVEEPGFDAGDVRGQPLTVAEWYGLVLAAVQQQHRDRYLGHLETPRGDLRYTVIPGALDPGCQGQLDRDRLVGEQRQVDTGARASMSRATWAGDAASIFSRSCSNNARAAA